MNKRSAGFCLSFKAAYALYSCIKRSLVLCLEDLQVLCRILYYRNIFILQIILLYYYINISEYKYLEL